MAAKNTYVSVFEKLTDTKQPKQSETKKRKKRRNDEEEHKLSNKELEEQIKERLAQNTIENRPIYTEEELAEIEAEQYDDEYDDDIDYDEYEEYYDDEDDN